MLPRTSCEVILFWCRKYSYKRDFTERSWILRILCIRDVYCRGCNQSARKIYWISSLRQKDKRIVPFSPISYFKKLTECSAIVCFLPHCKVKFLSTQHFMRKTILVKACNNGVS